MAETNKPFDIADIILPDDERGTDATESPPKAVPLRSYVMNKKSLDWAEWGLSRDALWAWDVLAAYWRRHRRQCDDRVPLSAEIKRKIAIRHHRDLRRVLDELAAAGLATFEMKPGALHRITWVDISGTASPPDQGSHWKC